MNSGTPKAWSDPIVDEIRQVREHYAATFGYDLQAIFHDLKSQEQSSRRTFTTYPARTASPTELLVSNSPYAAEPEDGASV